MVPPSQPVRAPEFDAAHVLRRPIVVPGPHVTAMGQRWVTVDGMKEGGAQWKLEQMGDEDYLQLINYEPGDEDGPAVTMAADAAHLHLTRAVFGPWAMDALEGRVTARSAGVYIATVRDIWPWATVIPVPEGLQGRLIMLEATLRTAFVRVATDDAQPMYMSDVEAERWMDSPILNVGLAADSVKEVQWESAIKRQGEKIIGQQFQALQNMERSQRDVAVSVLAALAATSRIRPHVTSVTGFERATEYLVAERLMRTVYEQARHWAVVGDDGDRGQTLQRSTGTIPPSAETAPALVAYLVGVPQLPMDQRSSADDLWGLYAAVQAGSARIAEFPEGEAWLAALEAPGAVECASFEQAQAYLGAVSRYATGGRIGISQALRYLSAAATEGLQRVVQRETAAFLEQHFAVEEDADAARAAAPAAAATAATLAGADALMEEIDISAGDEGAVVMVGARGTSMNVRPPAKVLRLVPPAQHGGGASGRGAPADARLRAAPGADDADDGDVDDGAEPDGNKRGWPRDSLNQLAEAIAHGLAHAKKLATSPLRSTASTTAVRLSESDEKALDESCRRVAAGGFGAARLPPEMVSPMYRQTSEATCINKDNPLEIGVLGATAGAQLLVERAKAELGKRGRAVPPKQLLLFISGKLKHVLWESFQVQDGRLMREGQTKIITQHVADAEGTMIKTAAVDGPSSFAVITTDSQLRNVVTALLVAGREAPAVITDGLDELLPSIERWEEQMQQKGVTPPVQAKYEWFLQVMEERHEKLQAVSTATSAAEALRLINDIPPMYEFSNEMRVKMQRMIDDAELMRYTFVPFYSIGRTTESRTDGKRKKRSRGGAGRDSDSDDNDRDDKDRSRDRGGDRNQGGDLDIFKLSVAQRNEMRQKHMVLKKPDWEARMPRIAGGWILDIREWEVNRHTKDYSWHYNVNNEKNRDDTKKWEWPPNVHKVLAPNFHPMWAACGGGDADGRGGGRGQGGRGRGGNRGGRGRGRGGR